MYDKILAKGTFDSKQLLDKKKKGCSQLEIHLSNDFIDESVLLEDLVRISENVNMDIKVIHTPFLKDKEINIEYLSDNQVRNAFIKTCELGNLIGFKNRTPILIVLHIGVSFYQLTNMPLMLDYIENLLVEVLKKYPYIEFGIENSMPVANHKGNEPQLRSGILFSNVDFVKYFRNKYKTDRIGTVLDTCHAISTCRFFEIMNEFGIETELITLELFFKKNKNIVKNIHLSNVVDLGVPYSNHGKPFTDSYYSRSLLNKIVSYYLKYEYNSYITIEVTEVDYSDSLNFKETFNNLKKEIKRQA